MPKQDKFKLKDLKVQSFVTTMDEESIRAGVDFVAIDGGIRPNSDTSCLCVTVNVPPCCPNDPVAIGIGGAEVVK